MPYSAKTGLEFLVTEPVFPPYPLANPDRNRIAVDSYEGYQHVRQVVANAPVIEESHDRRAVEHQGMAAVLVLNRVGAGLQFLPHPVEQHRKEQLWGHLEKRLRIIPQDMEKFFVGQHCFQDIFILPENTQHTLTLCVPGHERPDHEQQIVVAEHRGCPLHGSIVAVFSLLIKIIRSIQPGISTPASASGSIDAPQGGLLW